MRSFRTPVLCSGLQTSFPAQKPGRRQSVAYRTFASQRLSANIEDTALSLYRVSLSGPAPAPSLCSGWSPVTRWYWAQLLSFLRFPHLWASLSVGGGYDGRSPEGAQWRHAAVLAPQAGQPQLNAASTSPGWGALSKLPSSSWVSVLWEKRSVSS